MLLVLVLTIYCMLLVLTIYCIDRYGPNAFCKLCLKASSNPINDYDYDFFLIFVFKKTLIIIGQLEDLFALVRFYALVAFESINGTC